MSICCEVLGWGRFDVKALEDIMEEYGLNKEELADEVEGIIAETSTDINYYFHSALYLGYIKIKEKLNDEYPEYENIINNYEPNIYTNYLDSGFDSAFANYDYRDFIGSNKYEYLKDLMNELLEDAGELKIGEDEDKEDEDE